MMKYFLPLLCLLLLPFAASAAYNTVTFPQDINVYLSGSDITLVIESDSTGVADMTVYPTYISFTLTTETDTSLKSSVTITSSAKYNLVNSQGQGVTCGESSSSVTVTGSSTAGSSTVTVTPSGFCSSGGGGGGSYTPPAPSTPTTTTGSVTATASAGGKTTLTESGGGTATVQIPANTLTADTTVTVTSLGQASSQTGNPPAGSFMVGGIVYNISATSGGQTVNTFTNAVTLTFTYTDSQIAGVDETSLKIYRWDGTQWVALTTTVNLATNTLSATTTAFSKFSVIGQVGVTPTTAIPVSQMTIAGLQTEIARIMALIVQLQQQLLAMMGGVQQFTTDLYYGLKGNSEVVRFQDFLISKGYLAAGLHTGNYLSGTLAAVKAYQTTKGITPVNGRCGPKTRAAVNADLGVSQ